MILGQYLYNCHSRKNHRAYWRCHNYSKKAATDRCRARCVIVDGRVQAMTGGDHNHAPHTAKIQRILSRRVDVDDGGGGCDELQHQQQHDQHDDGDAIYAPMNDTNNETTDACLVVAARNAAADGRRRRATAARNSTAKSIDELANTGDDVYEPYAEHMC